jgi:hypothetical protein
MLLPFVSCAGCFPAFVARWQSRRRAARPRCVTPAFLSAGKEVFRPPVHGRKADEWRMSVNAITREKAVARKRRASNLWASSGPVAQRLEQATHNRLVLGSNPSGPTNPPANDFSASNGHDSAAQPPAFCRGTRFEPNTCHATDRRHQALGGTTPVPVPRHRTDPASLSGSIVDYRDLTLPVRRIPE